MTREERQHAYEVSQVVEALIDHDDPFDVHKDHYPEAERIVEAKRTGHVEPYTYLVVLDYDGRYIAVPLESGVVGCQHTGHSASLKWSKLEAVRAHERDCLGR